MTNNDQSAFGHFHPLPSFLYLTVLAAVTVFFKVKRVTVSGESRYSSEEVLEAAGIAEGENLFDPVGFISLFFLFSFWFFFF